MMPMRFVRVVVAALFLATQFAPLAHLLLDPSHAGCSCHDFKKAPKVSEHLSDHDSPACSICEAVQGLNVVAETPPKITIESVSVILCGVSTATMPIHVSLQIPDSRGPPSQS